MTVGMEANFDQFNEGRSMESILDAIAETANQHLTNIPKFNREELLDYEVMKPTLTVQLI